MSLPAILKPAIVVDVRYPIMPTNNTYEQMFLRFGEINNDGRIGFIVNRGVVEQMAYDLEGNELWYYANKKATHENYLAYSGAFVWDIDGDGKSEFITMRLLDGRFHIVVLDAATGQLKNSVPAPECTGSTPWADFRLAKLREGPQWDIIFTWDYVYVAAFSTSLEKMWEHFTATGHSPHLADVDGDGKDEVFVNFTLIDHDGTILWSRDSAFSTPGDHNDSAYLYKDDGQWRLQCSTDGILFDVEGNILRRYGQLVEGQHVFVPTMRTHTGQVERLVAIQDRLHHPQADGYLDENPRQILRVFRLDGTPYWVRENTEYIQALNWTGPDVQELLLDTYGQIVGGDGQIMARIKPFCLGEDFGMVCDIIGDGRDEIIISRHDDEKRTVQVEIYTNPDPCLPCTAARRCPTPARRTTTRQMADHTIY